MPLLLSPGGHRFGYLKNKPDHRDYGLAHATLILAATLPKMDNLAFMGPVLDQKQQGCHDEKTEVLTSEGWKFWTDYRGGQLLATVNPSTHEMEFQRPIAIQQYEYKGDLYRSANGSVNFGLTPNHRMFVRKWNERARRLESSYRFTPIENIGWYTGLLSSPSGFIGTEVSKIRIGAFEYSGDDFLALLSLVVTDGWVGSTESNWNRIGFASFKPSRREMVASLASRIGFSEVPSRPGVWLRSDPEMANWMRLNIYDGRGFGALCKKIPEIVKWTSVRQIEHYLKFSGDHHEYVQGQRDFYSSSRSLVDGLQELLLRIGKRSTLRAGKAKDVLMTDGRMVIGENCAIPYILTERRVDQLSLGRKANLYKEPYQGNVFCATVPNSTLITRRNGTVLISGNSCTAHAGVADREYLHWRQKAAMGQPVAPGTDGLYSPAFLYYIERQLDGSLDQGDCGSTGRSSCKALNQFGCALRSEMPYSDSDFSTAPTDTQLAEAKQWPTGQYHFLSNVQDMKDCIASGFNFRIGFTVYESFENIGADGIWTPDTTEQVLGGHEVLAVGYDDDVNGGSFLVRNSWGSAFGNAGNFYLRYADAADPDILMDAAIQHLGKWT